MSSSRSTQEEVDIPPWSTEPKLSPIADGGLGQQLRTWLDIVAAWDAAPAALLRKEVDLLCSPPTAGGCGGGELLGALIPVLLFFEDAKRHWSSRLYDLDTVAPVGEDPESLRTLQVLSEAASLFTGLPGEAAAWDIQGGLRAAKFAPVLTGQTPAPAVVVSAIAQRQLVPASDTKVSPFLSAVVETLQGHIARCNMPRPSECHRELALLCDVVASVDASAVLRLRRQVQLLSLTNSSAATYVGALHTIAEELSNGMQTWAHDLAAIRKQKTGAWCELQAYIANRHSLFMDESSICAVHQEAEGSEREGSALVDAALRCYGFRCVLGMVNANISVMAGKWDTPPSDYSYALTSMASWTVEMRRWVALLIGDMRAILHVISIDAAHSDALLALQEAMDSDAVWDERDVATLGTMKQLFTAHAPGWQERVRCLRRAQKNPGLESFARKAGPALNFLANGGVLPSAREVLPLGWPDLSVSATSLENGTPYNEMLALMEVIVRNERAIIHVMREHQNDSV